MFLFHDDMYDTRCANNESVKVSKGMIVVNRGDRSNEAVEFVIEKSWTAFKVCTFRNVG